MCWMPHDCILCIKGDLPPVEWSISPFFLNFLIYHKKTRESALKYYHFPPHFPPDTLTLRQRRRAPRHNTPQGHLHQACWDTHTTFFWVRGKTHSTTLKLQGFHQCYLLFSPLLCLFLPSFFFFSFLLFCGRRPVTQSHLELSFFDKGERWCPYLVPAFPLPC